MRRPRKEPSPLPCHTLASLDHAVPCLAPPRLGGPCLAAHPLKSTNVAHSLI